MSQPVFISSYALLRKNQITVDGCVVFEKQGVPVYDFLQAVYEHFGISYPKFFKMDNLSRVGFMAVETLMQHTTPLASTAEEQGIILSTANGCLDTDLRYEESSRMSASPALFVYTLPNILVGELSIRHGMKGETACFVFDIFDAAFQVDYVNGLFAGGKVKSCLVGWANYLEEKGEAFFYLATPNSGQHSLKHNAESVQKIFSNP